MAAPLILVQCHSMESYIITHQIIYLLIKLNSNVKKNSCKFMFKKSEKFTLRFITKSWIYNIKRQIIFIDDESSVHY